MSSLTKNLLQAVAESQSQAPDGATEDPVARVIRLRKLSQELGSFLESLDHELDGATNAMLQQAINLLKSGVDELSRHRT